MKKLLIGTLTVLCLALCLFSLTGCQGNAAVVKDLTAADFVYNQLSAGILDHMTAWGASALKVTKADVLSESKDGDRTVSVCTVTAKNEALTVIGNYVLTYDGKTLTSVEEIEPTDSSAVGAFYAPQQVILTVPKPITTVATGLFNDFTELTDVVLHANVIELDASAFEGCTSLKNVTFNCKEFAVISTACFKNCTSLTDFTIPETTCFIFEEAFSGCSSLTLTAPPESVVFVGTRAFAGCTSLTEANMGDGCDTISDYAFENCTGLKKIYVGRDMAEIAATAFVNCPNVEDVEIESTNKAFVLTANKMLKCRGTGAYVYSLLHEEIPLPQEETVSEETAPQPQE